MLLEKRRVLRCEVGEIRKGLDQIRLGDSRGPNWPNGDSGYREVSPEMWPEVLATLEEVMDPEELEEPLRKKLADSRDDSAEGSERNARDT